MSTIRICQNNTIPKHATLSLNQKSVYVWEFLDIFIGFLDVTDIILTDVIK